MIEPVKGGEAVESYSFDPNDPEDLAVTMGEVLNFINSERVAQGRPPARSVVVVGLDKPYAELGNEEPPQ